MSMDSIAKIYQKSQNSYTKQVQEHAEPQAGPTLIKHPVETLTTDWDGVMHVDSPQGALYLEFLNHFYSMFMQSNIPDEKTRRIMFDGFFLGTFWVNFFEGVAADKNYKKDLCKYKQPLDMAYNGKQAEIDNCAELITLALVQA